MRDVHRRQGFTRMAARVLDRRSCALYPGIEGCYELLRRNDRRPPIPDRGTPGPGIRAGFRCAARHAAAAGPDQSRRGPGAGRSPPDTGCIRPVECGKRSGGRQGGAENNGTTANPEIGIRQYRTGASSLPVFARRSPTGARERGRVVVENVERGPLPVPGGRGWEAARAGKGRAMSRWAGSSSAGTRSSVVLSGPPRPGGDLFPAGAEITPGSRIGAFIEWDVSLRGSLD